MYVLAPNQTVETFPYSIGDLRRDNPQTSFPHNPLPDTLADWSMFPVIAQEPPSHDPITENLGQINPTLVNGEWLQTWEVTPASAEVIAVRQRNLIDYLAFWDALIASSVYSSIREQSFVSLPMNTLATEFIALIGDAKAGRANEAAIQASISAILSTGTFTESELLELNEALKQGKLDSLYALD